jgi:hypothetical protein
MNKKGFGYIWLFVVTIVLVAAIGASYSKDYSWKDLDWNKYNSQFKIQDNPKADLTITIMNIAYKAVDALGYITFTLTNFCVKFALAHPEINWQLIFWIFVLSLLAPISIVAFKFFIIFVILFRDWRAARREKKEIRRLKEAQSQELNHGGNKQWKRNHVTR